MADQVEALRQYKKKFGKVPPGFKDPDAGIDAALAAVKGTSGEAAPPVAAEPEAAFTPIDMAKIRRAMGKPPKPEAAESDQGGADYFGLIRAERERTGCNFEQAAVVINRKHPQAWAAMLSWANGGKDFSSRLKK